MMQFERNAAMRGRVRHKTYAGGVAALAGLSASGSGAIAQCNVDVNLNDNPPNAQVVEIMHGEINYDTERLIFAPPAISPNGERYPQPYGDWLGYDATGLGDIDGDGFEDWAATWYFAEPETVDGDPRLNDDDLVIHMQGHDNTATPADVRDFVGATKPHEYVGFVRILSGKDNSQIGGEIWGSWWGDRYAHEIAAIGDLDDDGRAEIILSTNTAAHGAGVLEVYSFSSDYNSGSGDDTQRWVNILQITGEHLKAEFAYDTEDVPVDVNGDGQLDIITSSAFYRDWDKPRSDENGSYKRGACWVILMPEAEVFQHIAGDASWLAADKHPDVKRPLEMTSNDYSLFLTKQDTIGVVTAMRQVGDIDGDGAVDFVAHAPYEYDTSEYATSLYFFLSDNGYPNHGSATGGSGWGVPLSATFDSVPGANDLSGNPLADSCLAGALPYWVLNTAGDALEHPGNFTQIAIEPDDADFIFNGDDARSFGSNTPSIFGVDLDGAGASNETGSLPADMALFAVEDSGQGYTFIMLDMPGRFSNPTTNHLSMKEQIEDAIGLGDPIVAWNWEMLPGDETAHQDPYHPDSGADYFIYCKYVNNQPAGSSSFTWNAVGIGLAGNFDGDSSNDYEIGFNLSRNWHGPNCSYGSENLSGYAGQNEIWDFGSGGPAKLFAVYGEGQLYTGDTVFWDRPASDPPNSAPSESAGVWPMLRAEPGGDIDGDGAGDLVLRSSRLPQQIETNSIIDVSDGSGGNYVYYIAAGAVYVVLSNPADPAEPSITTGYVDVPGYEQARVTICGKGLVPPEAPFDEFDVSEIRYDQSTASDFVTSHLDTNSTPSDQSDDEMVIVAVFDGATPTASSNYDIGVQTRAGWFDWPVGPSAQTQYTYSVLCIPDLDEDSDVDVDDMDEFVARYTDSIDGNADIDMDGDEDIDDLSFFVAAFSHGCSAS